jgi:Domain of unknown function (DUF1707)
MAASGYARMLASVTDRDRAIEVVKTSFAEGRLTKAELDLRVGQALVSRYFPELMALIADLPVGPFGRLPWHPATPAPPRICWLATAAVILGCLLVLVAAVAAGLAA